MATGGRPIDRAPSSFTPRFWKPAELTEIGSAVAGLLGPILFVGLDPIPGWSCGRSTAGECTQLIAERLSRRLGEHRDVIAGLVRLDSIGTGYYSLMPPTPPHGN